jgi:hypothetical protein
MIDLSKSISLQQAKSLLALRCDELRELNRERNRLNAEIEVLEKFIKQEIDGNELKLFEFIG